VNRTIVSGISSVATFLIIASFSERSALAENDSSADAREPVNTVTVSPLPLVFNRELDIEYERAVSDDFSLFAAPSLVVGTTTSCTCSYYGAGVTAGARFFPGRAPSGVFLGAFGTLLYASASIGSPSVSGTGLAFETGGMLGYTFIIARRLDLSLGAGAAYAQEKVTLATPEAEMTVGANGVIPVLRLALGVAF